MRIERLDLLRFGHFTDQSISLPHAGRDLHVIVGPNEAGKSTVRSAILDLLFGIETRTTFDFVHPKAELCIGASLRHADRVIEFRRIKKARSLTDPAGAALPEDALAPFLNGASRESYGQMFGLDHDRLESGGKAILEASNDVGRILLQSATGFSNLGRVRDALETEADGLWAKRRSADRQYYKAAKLLEEAEAELKRTSVRGKDWAEARERVLALDQQLEGFRKQYAELESERIRLDRIRRVAQFLREHDEATRALHELGEIRLLPPDAARQLADAQVAITEATAIAAQATRNLEEVRKERAAVVVDDQALVHAQAIEGLAKRCNQTEPYERDIVKREAEVTAHWDTVRDAVRQLGWTAGDEASLRERLPALPVRRTLANLLKRHGALRKAVEATAEAVNAKQREVADNQRELERQPAVEVPVELRAALDAAIKLGDTGAAARREAGKIAKARRDLSAAETELGLWRAGVAELRLVVLPPVELVRNLRAEQDRIERELREATARREELTRDIAAAQLAADQYRRSHRAVTYDELADMRAVRDRIWQEIRDAQRALSEAAQDYERAVGEADKLADQRHDRAQEAAALQLKLDTLAQLRQQLGHLEGRRTELETALARHAADWRSHAARMGFSDMPLVAYEQWRTARERVLAIAESVELAETEAGQMTEAAQAASAGLLAQLDAVGQAVPDGAGLDVLVAVGNSMLESSIKSKERLRELGRQVSIGGRDLGELATKHERAAAEMRAWESAWAEETAKAGLAGADTGAVEGALVLFDTIDGELKAIQDIRDNRIRTMRRDLDDLAAQARTLAQGIAPELAGRPAAEVSQALSARLAGAIDRKKAAEHIDAELRRLTTQLEDAEAAIAQARGRLAPLMEAAGTQDTAELRELIARSDESRRLRDSVQRAQRTAEGAGDGLSLAQLAEEAAGADLSAILERVGEIGRLQDELRAGRERVSAEHATEQQAFLRIAGQDDAVGAATRRQDALAKMADAADRYIKVRVAERVLGWAIERYRESTQDPMLARASQVFAALTLGSFARLTVDYDAGRPKLAGIRPDKRLVETDRMSDGTRDQLYLALRLAALELHVSQGHPLPFIADDLFVNFDDARSRAGLEALGRLSERTQVIFLTHHAHLLPAVQAVFGAEANVVNLGR